MNLNIKETTDNLPYWYNQIGFFLSDRVTKAQKNS